MVYLIVEIEECRDLKDVVALGRNHPFVEVQFRGVKHSTGVAEDGKNPNFNHQFAEWNLGELEEGDLEQQVYVSVRHEAFTGSETIGVCTVPVARFRDGFEREWFNVKRGDSLHGQVMLTGKISEMAESYRRMLENPVPHVWLNVHRGREIPDKSRFFKQKPYLRAQVAGTNKDTAASAHETEPDWAGIMLRFPIGDGYTGETPVYISVRAEGRLGEIHLGSLEMNVGRFIEGFREEWFELNEGGAVCLSGQVNDFKKRQREAEEARRAEEARLAEEEARRVAEEARRVEEEARRAEEAARERARLQREAEEARRRAEEAAEAERERLAAELAAAQERQRQHEEALRRAEEARRVEAERVAREREEARRRAEEERKRHQAALEAERQRQLEAAAAARAAHEAELARLQKELAARREAQRAAEEERRRVEAETARKMEMGESELAQGGRLTTGGKLRSRNGRYQLRVQSDGNMVLYNMWGGDGGSSALWSTKTSGEGANLRMQSDGNLVLYGSGSALWASHTNSFAEAGPYIFALENNGELAIYHKVRHESNTVWRAGTGSGNIDGETSEKLESSLRSGDQLRSTNKRYRAVLQRDGNFVLYDDWQNRKALWASGTAGVDSVLKVQGDGNLVLYNGAGAATWASHTSGGKSKLVLQNDGNLVLYGPEGATWSSKTSGGDAEPPAAVKRQMEAEQVRLAADKAAVLAAEATRQAMTHVMRFKNKVW